MVPLPRVESVDKPREECGVFGVRLPRPADVAGVCHLGIFALQHRGQESCGICVTSTEQVRLEKGMGLVGEVFTPERLDRLRFPGAHQGVAHTRYSVTGSSVPLNAQPLTVRSNKGYLALVHNGNFTNAREIRDALQAAAPVTVSGKVGQSGRLFGAVSGAQIADAVKAQLDTTIDRRRVIIDTPIKAVGDYTVLVNLHPEVAANLKVRVVAE